MLDNYFGWSTSISLAAVIQTPNYGRSALNEIFHCSWCCMELSSSGHRKKIFAAISFFIEEVDHRWQTKLGKPEKKATTRTEHYIIFIKAITILRSALVRTVNSFNCNGKLFLFKIKYWNCIVSKNLESLYLKLIFVWEGFAYFDVQGYDSLL